MKRPEFTRSAIFKFFLLVLLLCITPLSILIFGGEDLRNPRRMMELIESSGIIAPLAFLIVYIAWQFVPGPTSAMTAASGLMFGPFAGPLLSITGAMLSAGIEFTLARRLGHDAIQAKMPGRMRRLDEAFEKHAFSSIAYMRLIFIPFQIVNCSAGGSSVRFAPFFWGTLLGILPASLALPYLSGLVKLAWMQNNFSMLLNVKAALALLLFIAVSVLPPLLDFIWKKNRLQ